MSKTYSSFEEHQSLTEGWRQYLKEDVELLNEDVQALADEMKTVFMALKDKYPAEYEEAVVSKIEENLQEVFALGVGSLPTWWNLIKSALEDVYKTKAVGEQAPEFGKLLARAQMYMERLENFFAIAIKELNTRLEAEGLDFKSLKFILNMLKNYYTSRLGQWFHDPSGMALAKALRVASLVATFTADTVYKLSKQSRGVQPSPEQFEIYLNDLAKIKQKVEPQPTTKTQEHPPYKPSPEGEKVEKSAASARRRSEKGPHWLRQFGPSDARFQESQIKKI